MVDDSWNTAEIKQSQYGTPLNELCSSLPEKKGQNKYLNLPNNLIIL